MAARELAHCRVTEIAVMLEPTCCVYSKTVDRHRGKIAGLCRRLFFVRVWQGHVNRRNDLPNPAAPNPSVDPDEVARTPVLHGPSLLALGDRRVAKETHVCVIQVI